MIGADTTFLVELEIVEHPAHHAAKLLLQREILDSNVQLLIAPQVLAEFVHIVSDPRRFQAQLSMADAVAKAQFWWNAAEVKRIFPTEESVTLALDWLQTHKLGRKRILDTHLAATLWVAGARRIITANPDDFRLVGFEILNPLATQ